MEKQLGLFVAPQENTPEKKVTKNLPQQKKDIVLLVFVDGAARGNPGPAGAGVYITTKDKAPLVKKGYYLGHKTNNQAEYLAFILACVHVRDLVKNDPNTRVIFHSDSQLLVRQIEGIYKIKNEILVALNQIAHKLLRSIFYTITHVERESNSQADKLANVGIDKRGKVSPSVAATLEEVGIKI